MLGEEWQEREVDSDFIKELRAVRGIDLCGERGEFHTFVLSGPMFKMKNKEIPVMLKLKIFKSESVLKNGCWYLNISEWEKQ